MVQQKAPMRASKSGGTQISRRTVTRGMAWSVPVVAVATSAPAYATHSIPPVVADQCGVACKHPGTGQNFKSYHFTFCFKVNDAVDDNTVYLDSMVIGDDSRPAYSGDGFATTVTVGGEGSTTCVFVDAADFDESSTDPGRLNFHYFIGGERFNGCAQAQITGDVCGTGTPGSALELQPKTYPHAATGPGVQTGCTVTTPDCTV